MLLTAPHPDADQLAAARMPKRSAMGDPVPLAVCFLLLFTCWTPSSSAGPVGVQWRDGAHRQRIDADAEPDEWKPIDYGHPMRDDPTLVYVPPVLDPVHYGIMTAEPQWPIRPSNVPAFVLPAEALAAAAGVDIGRAPHSHFRPMSPVKPAVHHHNRHQHPAQQQQRLDRHWHHQAYNHRRPVLNNQRRHDVQPPTPPPSSSSSSSPSSSPPHPALLPRMPVVPLHGWTDRERPRDHPAPLRAFTRPGPVPTTTTTTATTTAPDRSGDVIDRLDTGDDRETVPDKKRADSAKKPRKPSRPFEFVIQQGHSKVRKYGSSPETPQDAAAAAQR